MPVKKSLVSLHAPLAQGGSLTPKFVLSLGSLLPDSGPFSQGELQWVISLKGSQVL